MIPGISTGGGGFQGSSTAASSSDGRWNFGPVNIGGSAGLSFGRSPKTSQAYAVAIASAALVLGLAWLKKKGG